MDLVNVAQARSYRFRSVWDVYQAFLSGAYHVARLHTKRTADLFAYSAIMFEHCMLNPPVQALVNWDAQIRNASSLNKQPIMANVAAAETRFGHALVSLTSKRPALGPPSASSSSAKRGRARRRRNCLAYNAKRPCDRNTLLDRAVQALPWLVVRDDRECSVANQRVLGLLLASRLRGMTEVQQQRHCL